MNRTQQQHNALTVNMRICCSVSRLCFTNSFLSRAYSSWTAIKSYRRIQFTLIRQLVDWRLTKKT